MSPRPAPATEAGAPRDLLRLLVEAQTEYAIFLLDAEGRVTSWNPGAERIKGYSADEIVGRHFSTFYTDEDKARNHPEHELEVARESGRYEEEGWRVRKDGSQFWASVVISALFDDDELVGYAKVTRDLTEKRAVQEELRRTAAELAEANERLAQSERDARSEAERQSLRATALETVGRAIVARVELDEVVQTATDAATALTGAAFGAFFYNVEDERGERYTLYTISGVPREKFSRFPMPRKTRVFAPTFAGEGIVRSDDIQQDPRYGHNAPYHGQPEGHLPVHSYLAVPVLTDDGEVAGGLFFGHPDVGVFDQAAEDAATSIAASAAVAISNARLLAAARRETEARQAALEERDRVAKVLQESLLPPELPQIAGIELAARYHAGTELVGGDFYDVFSLGSDRWGVAVGDVCGSGAEAASRTALTRHSIRTAAMFEREPRDVLRTLNTALLRFGGDRFTTALFARFTPDPATGGQHVRLATGGHPPLLVCRGGTVEQVGGTGTLLGVFDGAQVGEHELVLQPGDTLVAYTDGLVEARTGADLFGIERASETLSGLCDEPVQAIADGLVEAAQQHADGPIADDIAVLVLRVSG